MFEKVLNASLDAAFQGYFRKQYLYSKFSEKRTFLTPDTHTYLGQEILVYVMFALQNGCSLYCSEKFPKTSMRIIVLFKPVILILTFEGFLVHSINSLLKVLQKSHIFSQTECGKFVMKALFSCETTQIVRNTLLKNSFLKCYFKRMRARYCTFIKPEVLKRLWRTQN